MESFTAMFTANKHKDIMDYFALNRNEQILLEFVHKL